MWTEQLTKCSEPLRSEAEVEVGCLLDRLKHPPPSNTDRSNALPLIWFFVFACFGVSFCTVYTFSVSFHPLSV